MKKTSQLSDIWERDFGVTYTQRKLQNHDNETDLRKNFWRSLFGLVPDVRSVVEFGCNVGMNLEAIRTARSDIQLLGLEPNDYARDLALSRAEGRFQVLEGSTFDVPVQARADLAFTCTVLIHVSPDDLRRALKGVYGAATKYILCMEYYWPEIKNIPYRGLDNALWKMDFGALWLKEFPLEIVETGYLDARDGFDRTTWWLFKKRPDGVSL